jgi:hypothetical protein
MSNVKIARKKPIEIEVIQITGTDENIKEIQDLRNKIMTGFKNTLFYWIHLTFNPFCNPVACMTVTDAL